jgi:hypothetical protein
MHMDQLIKIMDTKDLTGNLSEEETVEMLETHISRFNDELSILRKGYDELVYIKNYESFIPDIESIEQQLRDLRTSIHDKNNQLAHVSALLLDSHRKQT